ncbi:MAG: rod shape-determining protein [Lachnospiraceae bacterium]|nr:rod shape-determining protein [Lachnospiraceae bacterium]
MILSSDFGIDLGSDTIKIYDRNKDTFYSEKNMLVVGKHNDILAIGREAREMIGSLPRSASVKVPVTAGKINDVILLDTILQPVLLKNHRFLGIKPSLFFSVPTDMTEIERRAYVSISRRGRLTNSTVSLVEKAYVDAFALGVPVSAAKGVMIINAGASVVNASVISNGRIILERAIPCAGNAFTENIMASVRRRNGLSIGRVTAEELKHTLSDLTYSGFEGVSVAGMDINTGLPRDGYITSDTIRSAVREKAADLALELEEMVHRIPPQVLEQVKTEGVYLTGGSARIRGLSDFLSERIKIPVILSELYEASTVFGLKEMMNSPVLKKHAKTIQAIKR